MKALRWLLAGLAVLAGLAAATRSVFTTADVVGNSMAPTLTDGQRLLITRARWSPVRAGQIVVFVNPRPRAEPRYLVKRVVAIAGQRSPLDGRPVADGQLIVRGDNLVSLDSRQLGPIELSSVLGSATGRYLGPTPV
jgi:signal peptidase I